MTSPAPRECAPRRTGAPGTSRRVTKAPLWAGHIALSEAEFQKLKELIERRFGIQLGPAKRSLVENRLQSYLRELGYTSFSEYWDRELASPSNASLSDLADRITTNFTYFYREQDHFEYLAEKILPELVAGIVKTGARDLRLWCAAASTGEEPYTLAIALREWFGPEYEKWQAGLVATDISDRALLSAREAAYEEEALARLPKTWRRWFQRRADGLWEVVPVVRRDVTLRRFNLMNETLPFRRPFHVIFCRNVMIYFGPAERAELCRKLHDALVPGGYLIIGHSETIGRDALLQSVCPSIYRRAR